MTSSMKWVGGKKCEKSNSTSATSVVASPPEADVSSSTPVSSSPPPQPTRNNIPTTIAESAIFHLIFQVIMFSLLYFYDLRKHPPTFLIHPYTGHECCFSCMLFL